MNRWTQFARATRCLVLAAALPVVAGCFGSDEELALYCSLMSLVGGSGFDFNDCYDYDPGEFAEMRGYLDDVRAYRALTSRPSITGPGAPSFDAFMSARYPDWSARAESLRATMRAAQVADSAAVIH